MGKKTRVLILLSGGLDSTCLIPFYSKLDYEIQALFIDYGQRSRLQEKKAVTSVCSHYNVKLNTITSTFQNEFNSGLIIGRNSFLINCGLMSGLVDRGLIAIGIHSGTKYPDCSDEFMSRMQKVVDIYSEGVVKVSAPFVKWNKREIIEYSNQNKVPIEVVYSCENGEEKGCGECESCKDQMLLNEYKN